VIYLCYLAAVAVSVPATVLVRLMGAMNAIAALTREAQ
jgi:hypothetical protein